MAPQKDIYDIEPRELAIMVLSAVSNAPKVTFVPDRGYDNYANDGKYLIPVEGGKKMLSICKAEHTFKHEFTSLEDISARYITVSVNNEVILSARLQSSKYMQALIAKCKERANVK